MKSKYAYPNILRKIYIRLHIKYCKLFHKKYIREYTAVFKYKNRIVKQKLEWKIDFKLKK